MYGVNAQQPMSLLPAEGNSAHNFLTHMTQIEIDKGPPALPLG